MQFKLPSVSNQQAYGAMMSRGGGSKHKQSSGGPGAPRSGKPSIN